MRNNYSVACRLQNRMFGEESLMPSLDKWPWNAEKSKPNAINAPTWSLFSCLSEVRYICKLSLFIKSNQSNFRLFTDKINALSWPWIGFKATICTCGTRTVSVIFLVDIYLFRSFISSCTRVKCQREGVRPANKLTIYTACRVCGVIAGCL